MHAMGVAFEIACVALQLRNRNDPATTAMVAEKIIALAKAGERLCDRALERTRVRRPRSFSASRCAAPHAGFFVLS